jgi:hypothetical protein
MAARARRQLDTAAGLRVGISARPTRTRACETRCAHDHHAATSPRGGDGASWCSLGRNEVRSQRGQKHSLWARPRHIWVRASTQEARAAGRPAVKARRRRRAAGYAAGRHQAPATNQRDGVLQQFYDGLILGDAHDGSTQGNG